MLEALDVAIVPRAPDRISVLCGPKFRDETRSEIVALIRDAVSSASLEISFGFYDDPEVAAGVVAAARDLLYQLTRTPTGE